MTVSTPKRRPKPKVLFTTDDEGHWWPNTGHKCTSCWRPIAAVLVAAGIRVHPCCPMPGGLTRDR